MPSFSLLRQDIEQSGQIPKHTAKTSLVLAQSMLLAKTVNLNKAKDYMAQVRGIAGNTEHADYKLATRYFDQGKIDNQADREAYEALMGHLQTLCWLLLFSRARGRSKCFGRRHIRNLLLDGTKWEDGQQTIHLLTLSVVIADVAIPIWWEDLHKAGHSSQEERITYLQRAMERYDLKDTILIADREYVGYDWFKALYAQGIHFVIRVKEGIYHDQVNAAKGPSWEQLKAKAQAKAPGKKVSKRIRLAGLDLHYIILKNPRPQADDELIYLLSDWTSPTQAARMYALRWQIEVCFKHLKSNGLQLEQMNVQGREKRHLMMALAVLVYILAIREGLLEEQRLQGGVLYKKDKHSGIEYRAVSVFRKGLTILLRKFSNLWQFIRYLTPIVGNPLQPLILNV